MEGLEPMQGVRRDILSAQWPSPPCGQGWDLLQAAGVEALRVNLELDLFLLSVCISLLPTPGSLPQKKGVLLLVGMQTSTDTMENSVEIP